MTDLVKGASNVDCQHMNGSSTCKGLGPLVVKHGQEVCGTEAATENRIDKGIGCYYAPGS